MFTRLKQPLSKITVIYTECQLCYDINYDTVNVNH